MTIIKILFTILVTIIKIYIGALQKIGTIKCMNYIGYGVSEIQLSGKGELYRLSFLLRFECHTHFIF